jgi:hypothetical protein
MFDTSSDVVIGGPVALTSLRFWFVFDMGEEVAMGWTEKGVQGLAGVGGVVIVVTVLGRTGLDRGC